jgi:hypothetical protein
MVKMVIFVLVAAVALSFGADAQAANKKCSHTMEQCLQSCAKAGGRVSWCPKYCDDKARNTGCP